MLRKLSTLILCLVAAVATASAQTPPDNEIWYTTTDGSKIHINTNNLVSNNYYNGRGILKFRDRVTSIGLEAFAGCGSLTSITIPNSVTSIEDSAFAFCESLTSITIPNSVTSIGEGAFANCSSLPVINNIRYADTYIVWAIDESLTSYSIKPGTRFIGDWAFSGCSSLTSITIPESVTSIGEGAFVNCSSLKSFKGKFASSDGRCLIEDGKLIAFAPAGLTSYTISESVTSIREDAFYGCSSLTSITIPNSVTSIGGGAFYRCSNLKSFKGKFASSNGRCLIKEGELIAFAPAELTSYTIPESVTSIGLEAFAGCGSLTSITIPNSVTSIGEGAFDCCSRLTSITIPNSVTSIGDDAFKDCLSLISITIPNSVTSIGKFAFAGCGSLTSITIPERVTSIGEGAFVNCSSLTSITIPNSVTSIGDDAFYGCSLTSITIPNSVTSIGDDAFQYCSSLTSITIPNSVTSIGEDAFADCESLTSITIPERVTSIGEGAFANCSSLKSFKGKFASSDGRCLIKDGKLIAFAPAGLTSYTISESVTSIGYFAFRGCSNLTSITIPESVTSIGEDAFYGCSSLTSITIPESVTSIGKFAFKDCSSLTSITIPESVTSIGFRAFYGCSSLKSFKGKFASTDGRCLIKDGKLIVFANTGLTSYTIPDGVTKIGEDAFSGCSSLTSIAIPNSVTIIREDAFYGCSRLTTITIPNSVTSIGYSAFKNCRSLTSITIPERVTSIGEDAFAWCRSLTSIAIPNSVTIIREHAFEGCSSIKSVKVSNKYCYDYFKKLGISDITFMVSTLEEYEEAQKLGVTKIVIDSKYASEDGLCLIDNGELILFIGKDLTEYTIPESVTSIGEEAFEGCSGLKSVKVSNRHCYDYFKEKVADIAFYGANATADGRCLIVNGELQRFIGKGVTQYSIPESVTSIGEDAFYDCSSLKSVKVSNKYCYDYFKEKVTDIAFYGANATADGRCLIVNGELQRFIGKGVTEYSIPESVTSIGEDAFYGCSSLKIIIIPKSVTSIGEDAFYDCSSLTSIACLATTPPAISYISSEKTTLIYIPKKAVKAYKKDPKWSIYKKQIKPIK